MPTDTWMRSISQGMESVPYHKDLIGRLQEARDYVYAWCDKEKVKLQSTLQEQRDPVQFEVGDAVWLHT